MRFLTAAVSLFAALTAVAAQTTSTPAPTGVPSDGTDGLGNNAITSPTVGDTITAGQDVTISWVNVRGGSVTLVLVGGDAGDLQPVATIVANVDNTGSYTWSVPEDIPASNEYAIQISYDSNPNNYNYSDRFAFDSDVTASPTASTASSTTEPPSTTTETETSTTDEATTTETETETTSEATTTSTLRTSTTRRPSASETEDEDKPEETAGAPPSAASSTLSSPLAVIMAVLAAAIFIH